MLALLLFTPSLLLVSPNPTAWCPLTGPNPNTIRSEQTLPNRLLPLPPQVGAPGSVYSFLNVVLMAWLVGLAYFLLSATAGGVCTLQLNPAADLSGRIMHWVLPIPNKVSTLDEQTPESGGTAACVPHELCHGANAHELPLAPCTGSGTMAVRLAVLFCPTLFPHVLTCCLMWPPCWACAGPQRLELFLGAGHHSFPGRHICHRDYVHG